MLRVVGDRDERGSRHFHVDAQCSSLAPENACIENVFSRWRQSWRLERVNEFANRDALDDDRATPFVNSATLDGHAASLRLDDR